MEDRRRIWRRSALYSATVPSPNTTPPSPYSAPVKNNYFPALNTAPVRLLFLFFSCKKVGKCKSLKFFFEKTAWWEILIFVSEINAWLELSYYEIKKAPRREGSPPEVILCKKSYKFTCCDLVSWRGGFFFS